MRRVGRKGAGPGEYQQANGLTVSAKGDVVINDHSNNRLTVLKPNGDLAKTVPITNPWGYSYLWDEYFNARGLLNEYVSVRKAGETSSTPARRIWSADYSRIDTIMPTVCTNIPPRVNEDFSYSFRSARGGMVMGIPYAAPRTPVVKTSDGATWTGQHHGYEKITRTPAGKCESDFTITLRGGRLAIPAASRDSSVDQVTKNAARYGAPPPDLGKIPQSCDWVRRGRRRHSALGVVSHRAQRGRELPEGAPWKTTCERLGLNLAARRSAASGRPCTRCWRHRVHPHEAVHHLQRSARQQKTFTLPHAARYGWLWWTALRA